MKATLHQDIMAPPDCITSSEGVIIGKMHQNCNKYVQLGPECQQVTLKEPQYINFYLLILQFPKQFISMDFLGPYHETEKKKQE